MLFQLLEPEQIQEESKQVLELAVGIDLGTTHSLVAIADNGKIEVFGDEDHLLPSIVSFLNGQIRVGEIPHHEASLEIEKISSIKRLMGAGFEDAQKDESFKEILISDPQESLKLRLGNRHLTPTEISAEILRELRRRAEKALARPVTKAVITVPAYFDEGARTATKDAAKLAGLEVLRLINEPTAAAFAYGLDKQVEGLYGVYDFGGGTFDFSLLKLHKGIFQVLATGGDTHLGGDDIDNEIAKWIKEQRLEMYGPENLLLQDYQSLVQRARHVKEQLSTRETIHFEVNFNSKASTHQLSIADLTRLSELYIAKTLAITESVLKDAKVNSADVQGVVLVGGSTRMPFVRLAVARLFKKEPLQDINPDEAVVYGAALQAAALTEGKTDSLLLDVTPLSLGIETMGEITEKIIHRNSPIPISKNQEFTTYQDGQTSLLLHIVQGERELVKDCRSLARFELRGIPSLPAGAARILVTFSIDADGLLTVSAQERTTGVMQTIEVQPTYGLDHDELKDIILSSFAHAQTDMEERLLRENQLKAEAMVRVINVAVAQDGDLLSAEESVLIKQLLKDLTNETILKNRILLLETLKSLEKATESFALQRVNRALASKMRGQAVDSLGQ